MNTNAARQSKVKRQRNNAKGQRVVLLIILVTPLIKGTQYKGQRAKECKGVKDRLKI
jgi:hypothetical protein